MTFKTKDRAPIPSSQVLLQRQKALERQPVLFIVCGQMGVGKTWKILQMLDKYVQDLPLLGKKGRKGIVFDTNDDDYTKYRSVDPNHIKDLSAIAIRRIRPFNPDGTPMSNAQKQAVVEKILKYFSDGIVVLDDLDHYMSGARGQSMIGALCTLRHKGIDILITHQSIAKISTTEFQNCTWLRMHQQVDDITRYRNRIPKYPLVRIAQLIVNEQYDLASRLHSQGKISSEQARDGKSFYVEVNMREQKITGCSLQAFYRAVAKYINQEDERSIRRLMKARSPDRKARLLYPTRHEALTALIGQYKRFYDHNPVENILQTV